MRQYISLVYRENNACYGVIFPDFPGCISAGETFEDVLRMGAEALTAHVHGMQQDNEPVPEPRSLEQIKAAGEDWIDWDGAVAALVPLLPPAGRAVRINVTMDERLLAQINAVTGNRSAFLADAARWLLEA